MIPLALLALPAGATSGFDPTAPQARFEGRETWTQAEDVRLWSAIERYDDPDRSLFHRESFNQGIGWRDTDTSPWIATAFGTATPPSSSFLLHIGPSEAIARGTPILMVPGAGDNGSRGFVTLATRLDRTGRPVYALTFAHPHGDVFMQAEAIADAIAVIRERTGAVQVDLVAHSKGGIAAAVYAASGEAAALGNPAYASVGTRIAGEVRRLLFVAVPLGGVDTTWRWPGLNLYSLDADISISPTAWNRYYPSGTAVPAVFDDLADQDFLPDGLDLFPGQRQLLRRQPPPLPGSRSWLGVYALQPDWLTTYEGGLGFVSRSDGIDEAIAAGGGLIDALAVAGLDPDIAFYQLAGTHPLMPNADEGLADQFGRLADAVDYPDLFDELSSRGIPIEPSPEELDGLERGALVLGEISDRSDGLVLLSSASDDRAITARGGTIADRYAAPLSHLDLLYASPITGQLLVDAADEGGPEDVWMRGVGQRYIEADALGWIEAALADPPGSTDGTPSDSAPSTDVRETGTEPQLASDYRRPCGSCGPGGLRGSWVALLPGLLAARWRSGARRPPPRAR